MWPHQHLAEAMCMQMRVPAWGNLRLKSPKVIILIALTPKLIDSTIASQTRRARKITKDALAA